MVIFTPLVTLKNVPELRTSWIRALDQVHVRTVFILKCEHLWIHWTDNVYIY